MDPRRRLTRLTPLIGVLFLLGGCALLRPAPTTTSMTPSLVLADVEAPAAPDPAPMVFTDGARPYLEPAPEPATPPARASSVRPPADPVGRPAIAQANRTALAGSRRDGFVGGVQVFDFEPGRVFEVWTAPLRVTLLTLAPGETVTAKAAGDTVRWQIGESVSGSGPAARTHVLIKPLSTGLETNLILTTSQRVYMLALRSGPIESFNAAVTWDDAALTAPPAQTSDRGSAAAGLPPLDLTPVVAEGPLDARYRIEPQGRAPPWTPTAVFNDGTRTFLTLSPQTAADEAPALFVVSGSDRQLVNYRQADGVIIVDRVFDQAELRLGDRRPQIVRIRRLTGGVR